MGLPNNATEWADLLIEGCMYIVQRNILKFPTALLPKTQLHMGERGLLSPEAANKLKEGQAQLLQNPWIQAALQNPQISQSISLFCSY